MSWELRADPGRAPGERNIAARARRRSIWPTIAAVAAAAAFGGVIWFAYQDGREANSAGPPPVVKADGRPVKIKPDNPGGQEIPFQDSTVYDRLGPNGQKPVVEKLLPPPEAPLIRPPPDAAASAQADAAAAPPAAPPQPQTAPPAPDDGVPTALAPSPGSIVIQPPATRAAPVAPSKPAASPEKVAAAETAPPPPKGAPDPIAALIANQAGAPAPAAKAAGGYRIRLSEVRSAAAVAPEWARLKRRYPELAPLQSTSSKTGIDGKGTVYRVEAGPLAEADAKATCNRLRTEGLGCIVVKP